MKEAQNTRARTTAAADLKTPDLYKWDTQNPKSYNVQ